MNATCELQRETNSEWCSCSWRSASGQSEIHSAMIRLMPFLLFRACAKLVMPCCTGATTTTSTISSQLHGSSSSSVVQQRQTNTNSSLLNGDAVSLTIETNKRKTQENGFDVCDVHRNKHGGQRCDGDGTFFNVFLTRVDRRQLVLFFKTKLYCCSSGFVVVGVGFQFGCWCLRCRLRRRRPTFCILFAHIKLETIFFRLNFVLFDDAFSAFVSRTKRQKM